MDVYQTTKSEHQKPGLKRKRICLRVIGLRVRVLSQLQSYRRPALSVRCSVQMFSQLVGFVNKSHFLPLRRYFLLPMGFGTPDEHKTINSIQKT